MLKCDFLPLSRLGRGKVREMFEVGDDQLLMVATDRISACDVIMPNGIPRKGEILTIMTGLWLGGLPPITFNHYITCDPEEFPPACQPYAHILNGRSMLVWRAKPLKAECVVRGYLVGSGWKDYQKTGRVCGIKLPAGLVESQELPEPIFTPATKAETGHDENISFDQMAKIIGDRKLAEAAREASLAYYKAGRERAKRAGIIIADTKFEFGLFNGKLMLIDEVLTPDSSRFWPADGYTQGKSQPSFDKQFVRDYLEQLGWNKQPPAPELPQEIVEKTAQKYKEALTRLREALINQ